MRFMILVKATPDTEAGAGPVDDTRQADIASYHQALARAGVLLDAAGLQPSRSGWRLRYAEGRRSQHDGPFPDPGTLLAGYALIQVRSRDEAEEWARRFPAPHGRFANAEIEVRPLHEPGNPFPGQAATQA